METFFADSDYHEYMYLMAEWCNRCKVQVWSYVNFQKGWKGHLWQGRFASFPMDEQYLIAAAPYILLNPVRAGIVKKTEDYQWSSARGHLQGEDDILVKGEPLNKIVPGWQSLPATNVVEKDYEAIRRHERTGRPLGDNDFISRLKKQTGRILKRRKPDPKKKS